MIEIKDVSKSYGDTQALKNVSLQITKSELFGLIGPDGAGKTTLMRILVSLLKPDEGDIVVDGFNVVSDYKQIRKMVGYMPGRFSLYQDLTVEENLSFFASVFNTTINENYHLVKDIYHQIEPYKKRRAGKLSGGMKQKLALSCALIHKPAILVLDEPTTGVDAVSRKEFWAMLRNLKKEGITIVVSTPYMDEAQLCDRVALMQDGNVLAIDSPEQIVAKKGRDIYAIKTAQKFNVTTILRDWEHSVSVYPFGRSIHLVSDAGQQSVEAYLADKGCGDFQVWKEKGGIEDVFINLMKQGENIEA